MIKFLVTPDRFAEVATIAEFLAATSGGRKTMTRLAPCFMLNQDKEYRVKAAQDEDGDPLPLQQLEGYNEALAEMVSTINPKRLERLQDELMEAAKAIVGPSNGKA